MRVFSFPACLGGNLSKQGQGFKVGGQHYILMVMMAHVKHDWFPISKNVVVIKIGLGL